MAMMRWDPLRELEDISSRLSRLGGLGTRRGDDEPSFFSGWTPAMDIEETDAEYLLKADLPDVKKEDVKINIQDGMLVVEGERRQEKEDKGKKYHRIERSYGKFMRRLTVPTDVDRDKVGADYKDGVLTVRMPKAATVKPKSVDVKVA